MKDMIKWLRAQLDADERMALAADPGPWEVGTSFGGGDTRVSIREAGSPGIDSVGSTNIPTVFSSQVANKTRFRENASHIANNDPDRVLRQVHAHRAILDDYDRVLDRRRQHPDDLASAADLLSMVRTVKRLLPIYSDRDGYRAEWSA